MSGRPKGRSFTGCEIDPLVKSALIEESRRRGRSESEIVREALTLYLLKKSNTPPVMDVTAQPKINIPEFLDKLPDSLKLEFKTILESKPEGGRK